LSEERGDRVDFLETQFSSKDIFDKELYKFDKEL